MSEKKQPTERPSVNLAAAPDHFHPFLVKELRRALKGRGFLISLAIFLIAMSLVTLIMLENAGSSRRVNDEAWGMVVFIQTVYFLFIIPFFSARSDDPEQGGDTLDLLRMTAMSPMSIVTGRWVTLVFFLMTYGVMMLPYYFLRYLMGGYSVTSGLSVLGMTVLGSFIVCAWVTASTYLFSRRFRAILLILILFVVVIMIPQMLFSRHSRSPFDSIGLVGWLTTLSLTGLISCGLMSLGAYGLASPSQRGMFWLRVPWLLCYSIFIGGALISQDSDWAGLASICLLFGLTFIIFEEPALPTEFIFSGSKSEKATPFWHRILQYPGIGYGLWSWCLAVILFAALFTFAPTRAFDNSKSIVLLACGSSLLIWSYFLSRMFLKRHSHKVAMMLGFASVITTNVILTILGNSLNSRTGGIFKELLEYLPISIASDSSNNHTFAVLSVYTGASFAFFIVLALRELRRLIREERSIRAAHG